MLMFDNKHKNPTWGYILANMHKGAYAEIPYSKTMNQKKILALVSRVEKRTGCKFEVMSKPRWGKVVIKTKENDKTKKTKVK